MVDRISDAYERAAFQSGPRVDLHRAGILAAVEAMFRLDRGQIEDLGREIHVARDEYDRIEADHRKNPEAKR